MLSKSDIHRFFWESNPVALSAALHAFGLSLVLTFLILSRLPRRIEIAVIDMPVVSARAVLPRAMPPQAEPRPKLNQKKAVFGVSRKAITTASGSDVKLGNTVAKTPDQKILKASDADSLPIPAEEYLVSSMPRLLSEVRIPYPPEAKKNSVQGAVLIDILIDAEGKVREVKFVSGPGFGMNEAALDAVKGFRFQPAQIENQPVAVRMRYSYRFVLQ